jgi:UDP-glucose 4-epimerase
MWSGSSTRSNATIQASGGPVATGVHLQTRVGRSAASAVRRAAAPARAHPTMSDPGGTDLPGLRFQVLHSADAGEAYRLAVTRDVRGAFNIAADPVIDAGNLAELLDVRTFRAPIGPLRTALSAAWHLHLLPAAPQLFDAVLRLPVMDVTHAHTELGWSPRYSALDAIRRSWTGCARMREWIHPRSPATPAARCACASS